jgi:ADP-heptose:LPS heptosyltransferase
MAQAHSNEVFNPARILVIRWKSIGDVVQTLPAWNSLRTAFPRAHMTYMTSVENACLAEMFPGVDEVLSIDRRALFLLRNVRQAFASSWWTIWKSTLGGRFDLVVDLQGYGETSHLTFLSRARQRWGLVYRNGRGYAYTGPVAINPDIHTCDNFCEVLRRNGVQTEAPNRLFVPAARQDSARRLLAGLGIEVTPQHPLLCLQPLTTNVLKNWPLEKYAQLATHAEKRGFQIVISGGPGDRETFRQSPLSHWPIACGQDLVTTCGLVALANIVVGGDTGLMHTALAAGTRIIMIVRGHSLTRTGPYQRLDWAVSEPELVDLATEKVLSAFDQACSEMPQHERLALAPAFS